MHCYPLEGVALEFLSLAVLLVCDGWHNGSVAGGGGRWGSGPGGWRQVEAAASFSHAVTVL
jgi:hypothetical protein